MVVPIASLSRLEVAAKAVVAAVVAAVATAISNQRLAAAAALSARPRNP